MLLRNMVICSELTRTAVVASQQGSRTHCGGGGDVVMCVVQEELCWKRMWCMWWEPGVVSVWWWCVCLRRVHDGRVCGGRSA